jgi:8-amino-7-oxononanoate synthase
MASLDVLRDEPERRERLRGASAWLRSRLRESGIAAADGSSHIVPIHVGANEAALAVAAAVQAEGFDVRAIRPPTVPAGTARLRVSVNVGVERVQLERVATVLAVALREAGICSAVSS